MARYRVDMREGRLPVAIAGAVGVVLGVLALVAATSVEALPKCDYKWGYKLEDANTCEVDPLAILSIALGVGFAICALFVARSLLAVDDAVSTDD